MSDILDTIDGALDDWATSTDAMRWSPDQPKPSPYKPGGLLLTSLNVPTVGDALNEWLPAGMVTREIRCDLGSVPVLDEDAVFIQAWPMRVAGVLNGTVSVEFSIEVNREAFGSALRIMYGFKGGRYRSLFKAMRAVQWSKERLDRRRAATEDAPGSAMRAAYRAKTRRRR